MRVYLEQTWQDLQYAARSMRRTPAFALGATLCLAVGISVNTAAFSVLNAFMFRDFPGVVRQAELASISIGQVDEQGRSFPENASIADYVRMRNGIAAFSGVAAFRNLPLSVRATADPQVMRGAVVSDNYFEVLGTQPAVGSFMTPRDQGVVISHRFWTQGFGARPDIVGQVLTVGTRAYTITAVTPEGFFGLYPGEIVDPDIGAAELFLPLDPQPSPDRSVQLFGRLRPGATLVEAQSQADVVAARQNGVAWLRAGGSRSKDAAELVTGMLFAMAVPVIILLVACANLANQLLARALQRGREIAVRLSLGATRARVVRQLLVEAAVLALAASALGVLLARWLLDALRAFGLAFPFSITIDARVLAFTIALALLTAFVFGLAPALRATRTDLSSALKDGAPGGGYRGSRLRGALVVAQVAASLAMIAVSSVFVRAGQRPPSPALDAVADRALVVAVNLDLLGFDSVAGRAYQQRALERLADLPGVVAAGMAPFAMFDMLPGYPMAELGNSVERPWFEDLAHVSGDWFEATNTTALRGRLFSAAERRGPPTVAVVDEEFAREWWGVGDAIGRTLKIGPDSAAVVVTVVGVIPTRQEVSFRQPEGVVMIPGTGDYDARTFFYVRTQGSAAQTIGIVRQAVGALDPRVPILWARTFEDLAACVVAPLTMLASGLASLGSVALALAALGLFGVLSFIVAQRRYEIGIRVALGARRGDVTWMVVKQALRLGVAGVAVGAFLAVAAVTMLRALIHGLQPLDLPVFGAMAALMVLVALLASAAPALRAASVDPMIALRAE